MNQKVVLHMPVQLEDDFTLIAERTVQLPANYVPQPGTWLRFSWTVGHLSILQVGYCAVLNQLVVSLSLGSVDRTSTKEEWLAENPGWVEAENPSLEVRSPMHQPDPNDSDFNTDDGSDDFGTDADADQSP
jgi:hypothetical protein